MSIFGLGNPLLDISADVDASVLEKYGVSLNNAVLAEEQHLPVYGELAGMDSVSYSAGGATQNTIRVSQWLLQDKAPNSTDFVGCVGKDAFAEQLRASAAEDGVRVHYLEDAETPTGTCACLILKHERSLIANLAAANKYDAKHLDTVQKEIDAATIFYSAGFHLTVSPPAVMRLAAEAKAKGKTFVVNLSAPFICQFFTEPLIAAIEAAHIVIGNESEALAFAEKQGYEDKSLAAIAQKIAEMPLKGGEDRPRTVIITHGDKATTIVSADGTQTIDVPAVPENELVDVNGAGDAFVGGFLAYLKLGAPLAKCVEAGHYAAGVIVRTSGVVLKSKPTFE